MPLISPLMPVPFPSLLLIYSNPCCANASGRKVTLKELILLLTRLMLSSVKTTFSF